MTEWDRIPKLSQLSQIKKLLRDRTPFNARWMLRAGTMRIEMNWSDRVRQLWANIMSTYEYSYTFSSRATLETEAGLARKVGLKD